MPVYIARMACAGDYGGLLEGSSTQHISSSHCAQCHQDRLLNTIFVEVLTLRSDAAAHWTDGVLDGRIHYTSYLGGAVFKMICSPRRPHYKRNCKVAKLHTIPTPGRYKFRGYLLMWLQRIPLTIRGPSYMRCQSRHISQVCLIHCAELLDYVGSTA